MQHTDSATGKYELNFGDVEEFQNRSAYIDNLHYAAIESGAQVSNWNGEGFDQYDYASATGYLVSGDQLGVTQFFPDTFEVADDDSNYRPFCQGCDFIKWGAWGTRVEFGDDEEDENAVRFVDNVHLGWWVAGDITTPGELDDLWRQDAYATYNRDDWANYVAAGKLNMGWDFGTRSGDFTISQFDKANFGGQGLTFTGDLSRPDDLKNHFAGSISGALPNNLGGLTGNAAGSFVNNGAVKAGGVIGNWNVKNNLYKATGIFAGSGTPVPRK